MCIRDSLVLHGVEGSFDDAHAKRGERLGIAWLHDNKLKRQSGLLLRIRAKSVSGAGRADQHRRSQQPVDPRTVGRSVLWMARWEWLRCIRLAGAMARG